MSTLWWRNWIQNGQPFGKLILLLLLLYKNIGFKPVVFGLPPIRFLLPPPRTLPSLTWVPKMMTSTTPCALASLKTSCSQEDCIFLRSYIFCAHEFSNHRYSRFAIYRVTIVYCERNPGLWSGKLSMLYIPQAFILLDLLFKNHVSKRSGQLRLFPSTSYQFWDRLHSTRYVKKI